MHSLDLCLRAFFSEENGFSFNVLGQFELEIFAYPQSYGNAENWRSSQTKMADIDEIQFKKIK